MKKNNTYRTAYEACDTYFSTTGQIPTIEAIKAIINTNSPNTISSAIKDWKKHLSTASKFPPYDKSEFPAALIDAMSLIWKQALSEAKSKFDSYLFELESKETELEAKEKKLDEERGKTQDLLEFLKQKHETEITILNAEITRLSAVSTKYSEQLGHNQAFLSELKTENALLSAHLSKERENFTRLEKQYNKEHDWAIKRIEEEKNNYKQQIQDELVRIKSESVKNIKLRDMFQDKYDSASKQLNEYMERIIELERKHSGEKSVKTTLEPKTVKLKKKI